MASFKPGPLRRRRRDAVSPILAVAGGAPHLRRRLDDRLRRRDATPCQRRHGPRLRRIPGHLNAWCEHHAIAYAGVPVGTIKKHATAKGNADKQTMFGAMRALGYLPKDD